MDILGGFIKNGLSVTFLVFVIIMIGYLVGKIKIKGVSLGTAGVLLIALLYGCLASKVPELVIGNYTIPLFNSDIKTKMTFLSTLGTVIFVTAIGFIAGPKFFRSFSKKTLSYILIGIITIVVACALMEVFVLVDKNMDLNMAVGLVLGALTSTPGLSAAKEAANANSDLIVSGYGIAYLFGVFGAVMFMQIIPKILHRDLKKESIDAQIDNNVVVPEIKDVFKIDANNLFPFMSAIVVGCILGSFYIPVINFSLGNSGGCLISGLIFGHLQHLGKIDLRIEKKTLTFLREMGLVFFLTGTGVSGGVNFIENVKLSYFIYGAIMTIVPMWIDCIVAEKFLHLRLLNTLAAITGGMTSTPSLGALMEVSNSDDVATIYAISYPVSMLTIVILIKLILYI